ncbi:MAG TPA: Gldg family protein [Bryobacteraceae bacterium]|nr:Gldg family protein [Bryobacteraceae bacterium]
MAKNWMSTRQTKFAAYVTVYILMILAVLAAVNFLGNRYDKSYDATSNKQFSLSDQTQKLVKGLNRDVKIIYFDRQDQFAQARDLLQRYSNLSSKVHVDYIDPVKKPQQARAAGFTRDSNIIVDSGLRREPAKSLTEEEVTGALIRSLKTGSRNVCFLSAGGEHSIDDQQPGGFSVLKTVLERDNYKTRTITAQGEAAPPDKDKAAVTVGQKPAAANFEVPKDCNVLVVGGPQLAYAPPVVEGIKSYVEGGGKALFMLDDPVKIGRDQSAVDSPELLKLLEGWGITANKDLVLDLSGIGRIFGLGPEIPMITQYESHTITRPLERIPTAFPLARSLDVKSGGNNVVEKLFGTTEDSVAVTEVAPNGAIDVKKGKKGPFTLAASATITAGSNKSRIIVVGTSQWALNNLTGSNSLGNRDLFSNMVNWLSSDEDLISIRPKEQTNQALNMNAQRQVSMFWLSVVFFPLAVVAMGLGTWWKRR